MPLYIYEPGALEKLAIIEHSGDALGDGWLEYQRLCTLERPNVYLYSFNGFLAAYDEFKEFYAECTARGEGDAPIEVCVQRGERFKTNRFLYGTHGWNRYSVMVSGEIVFLRGFAHCKDCVVRVREVGVRVL